MTGKDFNVQRVNIRQLRKVALIKMINLCIWARNSNVWSVNTRQLRK